MTARLPHHEQPDHFAFTKDNAAWAKTQIAKYPKGREASAILPLLWRAQEQHGGWLPEPAIRHVAEILNMPPMRALEVASFYTMFQLSPVGRHHLQLCRTISCWLRGAEALREVCRARIGEEGAVSTDGLFSWQEVECLGACVGAPVAQIGEVYHETLTPEALEKLIDALARKGKPDARR